MSAVFSWCVYGAGPEQVPEAVGNSCTLHLVESAGLGGGAWLRGAQPGRSADLERLFASNGRAPTAPARLVTGTPPLPRTLEQEAFLAAIRNLDRFDRRSPSAVACTVIVVKRAIDWTRAREAERNRGRGSAKSRVDLAARARRAAPPFARLGEASSRSNAARGSAPLRARLHAGRDRAAAGPAARNGQLRACAAASTP